MNVSRLLFFSLSYRYLLDLSPSREMIVHPLMHRSNVVLPYVRTYVRPPLPPLPRRSVDQAAHDQGRGRRVVVRLDAVTIIRHARHHCYPAIRIHVAEPHRVPTLPLRRFLRPYEFFHAVIHPREKYRLKIN